MIATGPQQDPGTTEIREVIKQCRRLGSMYFLAYVCPFFPFSPTWAWDAIWMTAGKGWARGADLTSSWIQTKEKRR